MRLRREVERTRRAPGPHDDVVVLGSPSGTLSCGRFGRRFRSSSSSASTRGDLTLERRRPSRPAISSRCGARSASPPPFMISPIFFELSLRWRFELLDLGEQRAPPLVERAERVERARSGRASSSPAATSSGWFLTSVNVEHRRLVAASAESAWKRGILARRGCYHRPPAMDKLRITGGRRLKGHVPVAGAKNAALPALAATLLTEDTRRARQSPARARRAHDAARLGAAGRGGRTIAGTERRRSSVARLQSFEAPYDLVRTMRASVLVLGPLLARYGRARVSLPGGCAIGERPINLHIEGLHKMGADDHDRARLRRGRRPSGSAARRSRSRRRR